MSARIAHIYAPSYRAVCASMSNENELVTSLAQNRTDDLDAPFAPKERKGTLLQNTSSAQPWNANDRFEGLDWTHTHIYIIRYGLGYAMAK